MPTHLALLRGINVGGRNKVAMAALRDTVASLGHQDVATYIQSGNVVFTSAEPARPASKLAAALEQRIAERLAVHPVVVVLSRSELAKVIAGNPFAEEENPRLVHAGFWNTALRPAEIAFITAAEQRAGEKGSRDRAVAAGRTLYLHTPDGLGRSVLAGLLSSDRAAGPTGTMRNWATVTKLQALLDA